MDEEDDGCKNGEVGIKVRTKRIVASSTTLCQFLDLSFWSKTQTCSDSWKQAETCKEWNDVSPLCDVEWISRGGSPLDLGSDDGHPSANYHKLPYGSRMQTVVSTKTKQLKSDFLSLCYSIFASEVFETMLSWVTFLVVCQMEEVSRSAQMMAASLVFETAYGSAKLLVVPLVF